VLELNTALMQGQFEYSLEVARNLRASTRRRGNIGFEAAAMYWVALIMLRGHDTGEVIDLLEAAAAAPAQLNRFDDIIIHSTLALAYLRQGQTDLARQAADQAMTFIAGVDRPIFAGNLHGYVGVAAVYLALWEAGPGTNDEPLLSMKARRACKNLHNFARVFPIGKPSALRYRGLYDWLAGKPNKARRAWQKSLACTQALKMPFDEGLAHYEIARHLPLADQNRQVHLDQAIAIFADLGADYDLGQARALADHVFEEVP
jgi:hypothetical protein